MLTIPCIILFRISCNSSALYAPISMHYSQNYCHDHCQSNPVRTRRLCQHNFKHNTYMKELSIFFASIIGKSFKHFNQLKHLKI